MSYSVFRVNNYIKNGMDKDVVDPDGGVNLSKKRKILGVAEVVDPEIIFFFLTLFIQLLIYHQYIFKYTGIFGYHTQT